MPWIDLHPLYASRITKCKRWVAKKPLIVGEDGVIHDPNQHPHYEQCDAPLYPWTASTFPRPEGSGYDRQLRRAARQKLLRQQDEQPSTGNKYGFREGVEPIYGPERPRSDFHRRTIVQNNIRVFPGLGRWG
ncbi:hypothetical protein BT69DRAFT_981402 [Atractiella rhizophila]|nr:hypothetical protein BT69DRAFT_981402 [Atractiella rhizophila]